MLRPRTETVRTSEVGRALEPPPPAAHEVPGVEQPYATGERPPGILFYRGQPGFWLPYVLLQGMRYEADKLTLNFAAEDVIVEGRGLHGLWVELARQTVWRIVEQGERYASISDAPTHITRISEIPRSRE